MSKKAAAIAAGVLLFVGLLYWFLEEPPAGAPGGGGSPAMEFSNTDLHEMQNGQVVWKFKAGHVVMDADKNTAHLTDVEGYFKNDSVELQLTARQGVAKRAEKTLYLEGDVVGKTTDGAVLHAENLSYDGKSGKLSTDKAFAVEKDGRVLTADAFTADRILQEIEARGHARLQEKGDSQ